MSEWLSVTDTATKIAAGEVTAEKVVDHMLERIASVDREVGAYLAVDANGARDSLSQSQVFWVRHHR